MFKGILIEKDDAGYRAAVREMDESQLPAGDVTVRVSHSTLNYKDGLAITGKGPVVRKFPMVPGVDLVGTVEQSSHASYRPGDAVLLNGWGVGEVHWGGLAQMARVKGDWLVPLPKALFLKLLQKRPSKLSDVQTLMPLLKIAMPKLSRRQNHCGPDVQEQHPLIGDWPSHQRLPRLNCQEFGT